MTKRRARREPASFPHRTESLGRWSKGDVVSVSGERGRFRVVHFYTPPDRDPEVTVIGPKGYMQTRTFYVRRLSRLHRTKEL